MLPSIRYFNNKFIPFFALSLLLVVGVTANGQNSAPQLEGGPGALSKPGGITGPGLGFEINHEFHNHEKEVIVIGQLQKLEGSTVTIATVDRGIQEYKLNLFCKYDQAWIRHHNAELKKIEKQRPIINKLAVGLVSNKPQVVIETLRRLRSKGNAATPIAMQMEPLMKSSDRKIRNEAFICYVNIAPVNSVTINRIVTDLQNPNLSFMAAADKNKRHFISALKRYDIVGIPYLRSIAYTGKLDATPADASEIDAEELSIGGPKAEIRNLAVKAIGDSKAGGEAADILLEILTIQSEGEKMDSKSIATTIESLGKLGYESDSVISALEEHKESHEKEVTKAMERIKKANAN